MSKTLVFGFLLKFLISGIFTDALASGPWLKTLVFSFLLKPQFLA